MFITDDILIILHVRKYYFVVTIESLATCQGKSLFEGFFQLTSFSRQ